MSVIAVGSTTVCAYDVLLPERGAAALLGDVQIALFRTHAGEVFAIGNQDPFSGANVMSRGIVGSRGEVPTVASPMFKQVFDLRTGVCLDDPEVVLPVYPVEVIEGQVVVAALSDGLARADGSARADGLARTR
ncbi:nitrite reductase small subunit NirD [Kribbella hippodromi]|uniref:Nitrite reductase small subunit NirD n=1 Tax=Kribbella hippodromi TaxID=434347 RepID=A0ABN2E2U4_9ACTN